MTNPNFASVALTNWKDHPYYNRALVLGVDIGLKYLGLSLRLGRGVLAGETVVYEARASLEARRLKRHWRRNRRGCKQRIHQLRRWCARFGLPWLPLADWQKAMEPAFALRLKGEEQPGSLTPQELVVCLRHILLRRGYDWHRFTDQEGRYPWGDAAPLSKSCDHWLAGHQLSAAIADKIRSALPEGDDEVTPTDRATLHAQLNDAVARSDREGLLPHLRTHAAAQWAHRARDENYPREVLEGHARNLLGHHAQHLPADQLEAATTAYHAILNYHRKDEAAQAAHWESKAGKCPFHPNENRAPASDADVLRFRLVEFLSTRRFAVGPCKRGPLPPELRPVPAAVIAWLLQLPAGLSAPLPSKGDFRTEFGRRVCGENEKLATDKNTLNGDFFSQLRDLRYPRPASAEKRAALSARAAREWFALATANGQSLEPVEVKAALATRHGGQPSFYDRRREAALAEWFHPHTEFLLGPRAHLLDGKTAPAGQIHGWLNRLLARPEIAERLRAAGHPGKPDYVVIEVVGDIPRTQQGKRKIELAQKERRDARDDFMDRYKKQGLVRGDENSLLRAQLWEEQGGTDEKPALCPLTGTTLIGGPLSRDFEIAHIYPRTWGGPFQRDNLFLTTRSINGSMNDNPPAVCSGYDRGRLKAMRWPERKRNFFTTPWTPTGDKPDWGFDTRVAQLARQLRDAMKVWLSITDENEFAARVGTVSGYFTAQCRKAWLAGYRKDRADLRNHLYDAMVLTHIPPGIGLNSAAHGGIFETGIRPQPDGSLQYTYRPPADLGPDWQAFERAHEHDCLVQRPRSSASKKSRFDDSIYGIEPTAREGEGKKGRRLRIREAITAGGWPVKDAAKWFAAASKRSPEFAKLFPEMMWQGWIDENVRRKADGEPPLDLQLSGFAPVRAISIDASKPEFFDPLTLAAHGARGAKNPGERNVAIDLYEVPPKKPGGKPKIVSHPVLHPRFADMQKKWHELGETGLHPKPLPAGARFVARVTKRTMLRLPLKRDGEIADAWDQAYRQVWFMPTALQTDGKVELKPVEFAPKQMATDEGGAANREGSRLYGLKLKSGYAPVNEGLLALLRLNDLVPSA